MEVDAAYTNFFSTQGEAAVLACDELGLIPRDLLYRPKKSFLRDDTERSNTLLVRYTLTERTRQNNLRRLLAIKNRLILDGGVSEKWRNRLALFPDAPRVPHLSRADLDRAKDALDTESEAEMDAVDERGLMKPTPLFGADSPVASSRTASGGRDSRQSTATPSRHPTPPKQRTNAGVEARRGHRYSKSLLTGGRPTRGVAGGKGGWASSEFLISQENGKEVIRHRPQPPVAPPFLPPLPYTRRNSVNLKREEEELHEYALFLLRFAYDSSALAQECKEFDILYRARRAAMRSEGNTLNPQDEHDEDSNAENAEHDMTDAQRSFSRNTANSSRTPKQEEENGDEEKEFEKKSSHQRQLEAYVRLAVLDLQRNAKNHKKWLKFLEDMESYYPSGSLAAELQAKTNIGRAPSFEDYVRVLEERLQRRTRTAKQERLVQGKIQAYCDSKQQRAEENLDRVRNDHNDLFVESMRMHREISEENRAREERRRIMKEHRSRVDLDRKKKRAEEHHMSKVLGAKNMRYQHDQEEMFRQVLKDRIHDMDSKKKWDVKSVKQMV